MPGFEKLALEVLLFAIATVWVLGLTYVAWRLFEKFTVQPLRHRATISWPRLVGRYPIRVRRDGLARQDGRSDGIISRRAR